MIVDLASTLAGYLFLVAFILFFINYSWLEKYALFLGFLIWKPLEIIAVILFIVVLLFYLIIEGAVKFSLGAVFLVLVSVMFVLSSGVSKVGAGALKADDWLEQYVDSSPLVSEAGRLRRLIVELQTEMDDDEATKFNTEEEYQGRFEQVREDAKEKLQTGEWMLSVLVGGSLLAVQLERIDFVQTEVYGLTVGLGIQLVLFFLTLSITYRAGILDLIAFDGDPEFSSLDELDVAYSYQRMVSLSDIGGFATFAIVVVKYFSSVGFEKASKALKNYFVEDKSLFETLMAASDFDDDGEEEAEETEEK